MRDCDTCVYPDIECYQCVYGKRRDGIVYEKTKSGIKCKSYAKNFLNNYIKKDMQCDKCVHEPVCEHKDDYREVIDHVDSTKYIEKESIKCKYYISKKED